MPEILLLVMALGSAPMRESAPPDPFDPAISEASAPAPKYRDPRVAAGWSAGATLLPIAVGVLLVARGEGALDVLGVAAIAAGLIVGPAAGNVYVGAYTRALGFTGLRALAYGGGAGLGLLGLVAAVEEYNDSPLPGLLLASSILFWIGGLVLTIWDMATVRGHAEALNEEDGFSLDVDPTVMLDREQRWAPGLALTARF